MSPSLYDVFQPSYCILKGPLGRSSWSNTMLCLTENFWWFRRMHRIYFLNYFLLVFHLLGGRYVP